MGEKNKKSKVKSFGFCGGVAPCRLALLPVGVSVSVGGRAVGTGTSSVAVGEQSVSLIIPPRPESTNTLLCLSPLLAMGTSHDGAD